MARAWPFEALFGAAPDPIVVTDRAGRPLTGLSATDFQIFEDGRPQKITNFATMEAPFEVALLLGAAQ